MIFVTCTLSSLTIFIAKAEKARALGNLVRDVEGLKKEKAERAQEVDGLRQEMEGLRQETKGLKQETKGLKQEMEGLKAKQAKDEEAVAGWETCSRMAQGE